MKTNQKLSFVEMWSIKGIKRQSFFRKKLKYVDKM